MRQDVPYGVSAVLSLVENARIVVYDDGGVFDNLLLHPDRILCLLTCEDAFYSTTALTLFSATW
nr:hypothetical protein [Streptomyces griseus]